MNHSLDVKFNDLIQKGLAAEETRKQEISNTIAKMQGVGSGIGSHLEDAFVEKSKNWHERITVHKNQLTKLKEELTQLNQSITENLGTERKKQIEITKRAEVERNIFKIEIIILDILNEEPSEIQKEINALKGKLIKKEGIAYAQAQLSYLSIDAPPTENELLPLTESEDTSLLRAEIGGLTHQINSLSEEMLPKEGILRTKLEVLKQKLPENVQENERRKLIDESIEASIKEDDFELLVNRCKEILEEVPPASYITAESIKKVAWWALKTMVIGQQVEVFQPLSPNLNEELNQLHSAISDLSNVIDEERDRLIDSNDDTEVLKAEYLSLSRNSYTLSSHKITLIRWLIQHTDSKNAVQDDLSNLLAEQELVQAEQWAKAEALRQFSPGTPEIPVDSSSRDAKFSNALLAIIDKEEIAGFPLDKPQLMELKKSFIKCIEKEGAVYLELIQPRFYTNEELNEQDLLKPIFTPLIEKKNTFEKEVLLWESTRWAELTAQNIERPSLEELNIDEQTFSPDGSFSRALLDVISREEKAENRMFNIKKPELMKLKELYLVVISKEKELFNLHHKYTPENKKRELSDKFFIELNRKEILFEKDKQKWEFEKSFYELHQKILAAHDAGKIRQELDFISALKTTVQMTPVTLNHEHLIIAEYENILSKLEKDNIETQLADIRQLKKDVKILRDTATSIASSNKSIASSNPINLDSYRNSLQESGEVIRKFRPTMEKLKELEQSKFTDEKLSNQFSKLNAEINDIFPKLTQIHNSNLNKYQSNLRNQIAHTIKDEVERNIAKKKNSLTRETLYDAGQFTLKAVSEIYQKGFAGALISGAMNALSPKQGQSIQDPDYTHEWMINPEIEKILKDPSQQVILYQLNKSADTLFRLGIALEHLNREIEEMGADSPENSESLVTKGGPDDESLDPSKQAKLQNRLKELKEQKLDTLRQMLVETENKARFAAELSLLEASEPEERVEELCKLLELEGKDIKIIQDLLEQWEFEKPLYEQNREIATAQTLFEKVTAREKQENFLNEKIEKLKEEIKSISARTSLTKDQKEAAKAPPQKELTYYLAAWADPARLTALIIDQMGLLDAQTEQNLENARAIPVRDQNVDQLRQSLMETGEALVTLARMSRAFYPRIEMSELSEPGRDNLQLIQNKIETNRRELQSLFDEIQKEYVKVFKDQENAIVKDTQNTQTLYDQAKTFLSDYGTQVLNLGDHPPTAYTNPWNTTEIGALLSEGDPSFAYKQDLCNEQLMKADIRLETALSQRTELLGDLEANNVKRVLDDPGLAQTKTDLKNKTDEIREIFNQQRALRAESTANILTRINKVRNEKQCRKNILDKSIRKTDKNLRKNVQGEARIRDAVNNRRYKIELEAIERDLKSLDESFKVHISQYQKIPKPKRTLMELLKKDTWNSLTDILSLGMISTGYQLPQYFISQNQISRIGYNFYDAIDGFTELKGENLPEYLTSLVSDFLTWADKHPERAELVAARVALTLSMFGNETAINQLAKGLEARAITGALLNPPGKSLRPKAEFGEEDMKWIAFAELAEHGPLVAAGKHGLSTAWDNLTEGKGITGALLGGITTGLTKAVTFKFVQNVVEKTPSAQVNAAVTLSRWAAGNTAAEIFACQQRLAMANVAGVALDAWRNPSTAFEGIRQTFKNQWELFKEANFGEKILRIAAVGILPVGGIGVVAGAAAIGSIALIPALAIGGFLLALAPALTYGIQTLNPGTQERVERNKVNKFLDDDSVKKSIDRSVTTYLEKMKEENIPLEEPEYIKPPDIEQAFVDRQKELVKTGAIDYFQKQITNLEKNKIPLEMENVVKLWLNLELETVNKNFKKLDPELKEYLQQLMIREFADSDALKNALMQAARDEYRTIVSNYNTFDEYKKDVIDPRQENAKNSFDAQVSNLPVKLEGTNRLLNRYTAA